MDACPSLPPAHEEARLQRLRVYDLLHAAPDPLFDDVAELAARALRRPIGIVDVIGDDQVLVKAAYGVGTSPLPIEDCLCPTVVARGELCIYEDAAAIPELADRAVVRDFGLRFYAGAPIVDPQGFVLGAVCVSDFVPGQLSEGDAEILRLLARQVVERLEARCRERDRAELLAPILEQTDEGVVVADATGTVRYVNRTAREQHGVPLREVGTDSWTDAYGLRTLDGEPMPLHEAPLFRALTGSTEHEARFRVRRPDGTERVLSGTATPVRDEDGSIVAAVLLTRDETERARLEAERDRSLEEARAALRVREDFLGVAAHELRTPITSLVLQERSLTRALSQRDLDTVALKAAGMRRQLDRLARLVSDLLDVGVLEAGRLPVGRAEEDLVALARGVLGRFEDLLQRSACEVSLEAPPSLHLRTDGHRLEQVLVNLLTNACKYGGGAPVTVRVRDEGTAAVLEVEDRGIGISDEDRRRIFDRFERTEGARPFGGIGLGLYIARRMVEALGGTIEVDSALGRGSTFRVRLPAGEQELRQQDLGDGHEGVHLGVAH